MSELSCQPALAEIAGVASHVKDRPNKSIRDIVIVAKLSSLSESAEGIFTLAQSGKRDQIKKKLENLKKIVAAFDIIRDEESLILLRRLTHTVEDLDKAVTAQNRIESMLCSNGITSYCCDDCYPLQTEHTD